MFAPGCSSRSFWKKSIAWKSEADSVWKKREMEIVWLGLLTLYTTAVAL